jgi:hypothetical protein
MEKCCVWQSIEVLKCHQEWPGGGFRAKRTNFENPNEINAVEFLCMTGAIAAWWQLRLSGEPMWQCRPADGTLALKIGPSWQILEPSWQIFNCLFALFLR